MDSKTDRTPARESGLLPAPRLPFPCCPFMLSILLSKARFSHTITQGATGRSSAKTIGRLESLIRFINELDSQAPRVPMRAEQLCVPGVCIGAHPAFSKQPFQSPTLSRFSTSWGICLSLKGMSEKCVNWECLSLRVHSTTVLSSPLAATPDGEILLHEHRYPSSSRRSV